MCAIVDILLVLVVVLIVVLVWRGPSMLPQFGQALGKAVKGVRDNVNADAAPRRRARPRPTPPGPRRLERRRHERQDGRLSR